MAKVCCFVSNNGKPLNILSNSIGPSIQPIPSRKFVHSIWQEKKNSLSHIHVASWVQSWLHGFNSWSKLPSKSSCPLTASPCLSKYFQDGAGLAIWEQNSKVSINLLIILKQSYFAITLLSSKLALQLIIVAKFNVLQC